MDDACTTPSQFQWHWENEGEIPSVARDLAQIWVPPSVVLMMGPMGSGKTTLTKAVLKEMGVTRGVKSPTYDLVHHHQAGPYRLVHADLYRLPQSDSFEGLDLPYPGEADTMLVVEWGEALTGRYPDYYVARLEITGSARTLLVQAYGENAAWRLRRWMASSRADRRGEGT